MTQTASKTRPINVFLSYSQADKSLRDELELHLAMLKRQSWIASWQDREIQGGQDWDKELDSDLETADLILLLISPDYLASDDCYEVEVKRAFERHKAGNARVIPIILRPTDWIYSPVGSLQALPKNAKPVTTWTDRDTAFFEVAKGIRRAVEDLAQGETPALERLKSEVLTLLRKRKSMPFLELSVVLNPDAGSPMEQETLLQKAVQSLEKEGRVKVKNPDNILEEIVSIKGLLKRPFGSYFVPRG